MDQILASVTVPMSCAICGRRMGLTRDPMIPSIPLGRIRICGQCRHVVCRRHSVRVAKDEFVCVDCRVAKG